MQHLQIPGPSRALISIAEAETPGKSQLAPRKSAAERMLVVDDEGLIRWAIGETFRERGWDVTEARDAREALMVLRSGPQPLDAIVLDCRLPDTDCLRLLSIIKALWPETPVVMISAHWTPELAEDASRQGAYRVMYKPFEMPDLLAVVLQALRDRAQ